MKPFYFHLALILLIATVSACEKHSELIPTSTVDDYLKLEIEEVPLYVQIAITRSEQKKGLMHRESLPKDSGMLFPYKSPQQMSFWMANTQIPLDIAFFDQEGVLKEIHRLYPNDTSPKKSISDELCYALEMEQGWFRSKGIKAGDQLNLVLLGKALEQRGEDRSDYNLLFN